MQTSNIGTGTVTLETAANAADLQVKLHLATPAWDTMLTATNGG